MAKILLVEDNEMNRDMLSRRLQRRGHEVLVAGDGADGVAKAKDEVPALILMDMSLPVLDGWEATRQIKADPVTSGIPVIALTIDMPGQVTGRGEAGAGNGPARVGYQWRRSSWSRTTR